MAYWSEWLTPTVASSSTGVGGPAHWVDADNSIDSDDQTYTRTTVDEARLNFYSLPAPGVDNPEDCEIKAIEFRALASVSNSGGSPLRISRIETRASQGFHNEHFNREVSSTSPQWEYFGEAGDFSPEFADDDPSQVGSWHIVVISDIPSGSSTQLRVHRFEARILIEGPKRGVSETLELSSSLKSAATSGIIAEIVESYLIKGGQAQKFIAARLLSDIVGMHGQRYGSELSLKVCAAKYYTWPVGLFHIPEFASLRMRSHDVLAMDDGIRIRQNSDGPMADLSATWIWVGDDADTMERWIRQTCDTPFTAQAEIFGQPQKIYGAWLSPPTIARRTRHIEVSGEMSIVW